MGTEAMQPDFRSNAQSGFLARGGRWVRQFVCGLRGHDDLLHFERGRMSLMCTSCGYESPGWDVKVAPIRRQSPAQRAAVRLPLVRRA